jgi:tetratricopeptide (TPR) repeat protein
VVSAQNTKEDTIIKPPVLVDRYDLIMLKGAAAVSNENFDEAKALYNEAILLRPNDPVATGMLITVNNSIKALEVIRLRNADLKRKADINILLKQAENEVAAKNYVSAKIHYEQVLALNPIKSQEEFAKQRIRAIEFASSNSAKSTGQPTPSSKPAGVMKSDSTTAIVKKEPANVNTTTAPKSLTEPPKKFEKGAKDSTVATNRITTQSVDSNRKVSENERNISRNDDVAKQAVIQKQNVDSNRKAQETERNVGQNSANINPAVVTKETAKQEAKPSLDNANNQSKDVAKQAVIQKQKDDANKKAQETESKKVVANPPIINPPVSKSEPAVERHESASSNKQELDSQTAGKARVDSLIENAIRAINRENWQTALDLYNEVLTLHPTVAQRSAISSEISSIKRNLDKAKLKSGGSNVSTTISPAMKNTPALSNEKSVSKPVASKTRDTGVSVTARKDIAATSANKPVSIINMPTIANESDTPSISQSSAVAMKDNDKEDIEFSRKIITQTALLHLTDSNRQVKLICQGISTNGKNTFIKFLIKNDRQDSEFNIGALQMMHIQNSGKLKKLGLRYISDAEVVLPKREMSIVVVTENPSAIERNEVFVFEMEDQSQNTKLTINLGADNFPGKNNQAKAF